MKLMAIGVAVAVTGCSQDLCHQIQSVAKNETQQLSTCLGGLIDAGASDSDQQLQTCETEIQQCTSADQAAMSSYVNCVGSLPTFQCKWIAEALTGTNDPSLTQYESDSAACQAKEPTGKPGQAPALSPQCTLQGLGTTSTSTTSGGTSGGTSGTSGTTGTTTGGQGYQWAGTYAPDGSSSFTNTNTGTSEAVSGTETVTESGTMITISNFGFPVLVGCTATLTLGSPTSNYANNPSQTCGDTTLSLVEATISGSSGVSIINLSGNAQLGSNTFRFTINLDQE